MRTRLILITGAMTLLPLTASAAQAETPKQQAKAATQAAKQEKVDAWCNRVQNNVGRREKNVNQHSQNLAHHYADVQAHVQNIIQIATAANADYNAGIDVGKLQNDLATYEADGNAFTAALNSYENDLKNLSTDQSMCGNSHGAFADMVKQKNQEFRSTVLPAKRTTDQYWAGTLKPEIQQVVGNQGYKKERAKQHKTNPGTTPSNRRQS